ncbi:DUF488 domain-containing protein [Pseudactinotalea sp. Z1739]|uniref:DUF488 domain-containing protein n=1 Tax=Pseudactinotalea sp. Z1739 TaxID=3413028 RepID=UPI003C7B1324
MRIGRVYDPVESGCYRVLADRIWPRGLRKDDPRTGRWWPALAPSNDLRRWYGHEPDRFEEFASRYRAELESGEGAQALTDLRALAADGEVMLVTATKDLDHSHLAVLVEVVQE